MFIGTPWISKGGKEMGIQNYSSSTGVYIFLFSTSSNVLIPIYIEPNVVDLW